MAKKLGTYLLPLFSIFGTDFNLARESISEVLARIFKHTVVFRGPIFCRQCFQIPLDLILSYRFIIMFINKKSLFFTTYLIFQTRTMRIQWAIFGPKVSIWHHRRQNVFYAFGDRANLDWRGSKIPKICPRGLWMAPYIVTTLWCFKFVSQKIN